ncbi:hypothetical protein Dimus_028909 [Dionaea muscipula]
MPTKLMNKGTKLINKGTKLIWRAEQQCRRAHFSSSCSVNSGGGPAHVGACLLQCWCRGRRRSPPTMQELARTRRKRPSVILERNLKVLFS